MVYALWACYAGLAADVGVHTVFLGLHGGLHWSRFDGWGVCGVELVASMLCFVAGSRIGESRVVARVLAFAILFWALGDAAEITPSLRAISFTPLIVESLHLAFFPLAAAGVVAGLWDNLRTAEVSHGIDGVMAGVGAAAVCSVFAFQLAPPAVDNATAALHVAGLVAVVVLAALVAGCLGATSGHGLPSSILGGGMTLVIAGSIAHMFQDVSGYSGFGMTLESALWPAGMVVVSSTVWLRPESRKREHRSELSLLNLAPVCALAIQFVNVLQPLDRIALTLATLTLLAGGIRLMLLLRETRLISDFRHGQAATDELTGLWNRRHLFRILDSYFAKRATAAADTSLAFLFVDLNRFKEINDSFGHATGDQLLKLLAARFAGFLRDSDVLGRLGGDEFAVILPNSDLEAATNVALRLSTCLDHPFHFNGVSPSLGSSIGIAIAPEDAQDTEALVRCADVAMYRAKMENSRLASYEETVDQERDQMRLLEELRTAIDEDELILYYQPQLDMRKGTIVGVEALLRWRHPRLGLLAPIHFLPVAQEAGEMDALTGWVLEHATAQCATWKGQGLGLSVSVNVPPSSLLDPDLVSTVRNVLDRHNLPASSLVLEITENWVMSEIETARRSMQRIADLGVAVSIDDFGAGATSLAYLSNLPAKELKLDRAFVDGLGPSEGNEYELVRSTIDLGHSLGLRIVAEGVEDAEILELLSKLGCDLVQGYYISKPKPPNELAFQPKRGWSRAA